MRMALAQRGLLTITTIGVMLLLVACSAPEPTPTPVPPTPDVTGIIEVTFDGKECLCTGPETVQPGEVTIIFNNKSDGLISVEFLKHHEGKTWDDMLARIPPPYPTHSTRAPWVSPAGTVQTIAGKTTSRSFRVTPGVYSLLCWIKNTHMTWPGVPLYVEE